MANKFGGMGPRKNSQKYRGNKNLDVKLGDRFKAKNRTPAHAANPQQSQSQLGQNPWLITGAISQSIDAALSFKGRGMYWL